MGNISSDNIILYLLNFENEIATMFEIFIKYVLLDKIHVYTCAYPHYVFNFYFYIKVTFFI